MSLFCFCAGILSLAYYVLIVVYAGITADFAWFWVLLTAVLEGSAVLIRYGRNHPGIFPGWLELWYQVAVLIGSVCFGFICSRVISGMKSSEKEPGLCSCVRCSCKRRCTIQGFGASSEGGTEICQGE